MSFSRRTFLSGITSASAVAMSGLLGEMRVQAADPVETPAKTARILFNENPLGASPKAIEAIKASVDKLSRYPLSESRELKNQLCMLHGLPHAELGATLSLRADDASVNTHDLVLGVGSSEVLDAAAWAFCSGGGNVVEPHPSYSAIGGAAAAIPGANVQRKMVPLDAKRCIDTKAMIEAIDSNTKMVVICNPNNPTGTTISLAEIEAIAKAAPPEALVFVDEAYIEFLGNESTISAMELAKSSENVLVARTFSKIYGLAGLRVGYGVASSSVISRISAYMLGPLSLSMAGIVAAKAAIDDTEHIVRTRQLKNKIHDSWVSEFKAMGWKMTPSSACFCWVDTGADCGPLVSFLASRGVLISGGQRWDLPTCVRISIGTEEENEQLIAGLRAFKQA